jgi:peptide methionine sulfoxide reductase msrA/msrB
MTRIGTQTFISLAVVAAVSALYIAVLRAGPPTLESSSSPAFTNTNPMDTTNFKKPSEAELKKQLDPLQFDVTQKAATEPALGQP